MATTEQQIEKAKELAKLIEGISGVDGCVVDDWKDSGFTLFASIKGRSVGYTCWPEGGKDYNLRGVVAKIRSVAKEYVNYVEGPKREYTHLLGKKYFDGYDSSQILIDINIPEN